MDKVVHTTLEFGNFFKPRGSGGTGMEAREAIEIVVEMARSLEALDDFEWNEDHSETCGIVGRMIE